MSEWRRTNDARSSQNSWRTESKHSGSQAQGQPRREARPDSTHAHSNTPTRSTHTHTRSQTRTHTPISEEILQSLTLVPPTQVFSGRVDGVSGYGVHVDISYKDVLVRGLCRNFGYNANTRNNFISGDEIEVTIKHVNVANKRIDFCPTKKYVRPLLVLDINGVLGKRGDYDAEKKERKREFTKRLFCDDFVRMCGELFEIGIWSAAIGRNIELDLFKSVKVVCVFDQTRTVSLWPRRSMVSPAKPLFVKPLNLLWEEFPCFDASNTILVDNHLEKFEGSPWGNCICIPEPDSANDSILAPDGLLCTQLRAMCLCEDVGEYVRTHIHACEYFPHAHPTPPQNVEPAADVDSIAPAMDETPLQEEDVITMVLKAIYPSHTPAQTQTLRTSAELPLTRTVSLRSNMLQLLCKDSGFVCCDKSDGDRCLFVCVRTDTYVGVYLLDRWFNLLETSLTSGGRQALKKMFVSGSEQGLVLGFGLTVFDGEIVNNLSANPTTPTQVFKVFDAISVFGNDVGNVPNLFSRLDSARDFVQRLQVAQVLPYGIMVKSFFDLTEGLDAMMRGMDCSNTNVWTYSDQQVRSLCDGIVFTPTQTTYTQYLARKWKPPHMHTIDVCIYIRDLREKLGAVGAVEDANFVIITGYAQHKSDTIPLCDVAFPQGPARDIIQSFDRRQMCCCEIGWIQSSNRWELRKVRPERTRANSARTAWGIFECVCEHLTWDKLVQSVHSYLALEPDEQSTESKTSDMVCTNECTRVLQVSNHYDARQQERNDDDPSVREPNIETVRRLNNFAKAWILKTLPNTATPHLAHVALSEYKVSPIPDMLTQHMSTSQHKPRRRNPKHTQPHVCVCDLACGRGGDIGKFTAENNVTVYLGVDISAESVTEAEHRLRSSRSHTNPKHWYVCVSDAASPSLVTLPKVLQLCSAVQSTDVRVFDLCTCMFALHYFCESVETLGHFLDNVQRLVKIGGKFVCIFPDPRKIITVMRSVCNDPSLYPGLYKVEPDEICAGLLASHDDDQLINMFGIRYKFSLGSAVIDCPEYLVPIHLFLMEARTRGLVLSCNYNLTSVVAESLGCSEREAIDLAIKMHITDHVSEHGAVTPSQWEVVGLYTTCVFEAQTP